MCRTDTCVIVLCDQIILDMSITAGREGNASNKNVGTLYLLILWFVELANDSEFAKILGSMVGMNHL